MQSSTSTRAVALAAGLAAWALLAWNTAAWRPGELDNLQRHTRRYWEEVTVATSQYLNAGRDARHASLASNEGGALYKDYKRYMPRAASETGLRPWQFWRTIKVKPFLKRERLEQRPYDDPGRMLLMRLGFHLLGGVAPYLGVWLGVLFGGPVLVWIACELCAAGRAVAGVVLPLLLATSGFFVEVLALAYSSVGFYVIALGLLVAFAAYALLAPLPTRRGLLLRGLGAGVSFALCALCRSGTLLLAPGFLLAAAWGATRVLRVERGEAAPPAWRPRALLALVVGAALLGPYALVRPPRHHGIWGDLWQGLGDFDRTRGHSWSDGELRQLLRREGLRIGRNVGVDFESVQTEATLRRIFLDEVRAAPGWYAAILVRRVAWTLTQWKLHPYGPTDGISIAPQTSENEGLTDAYYAMVTPVDVFGLGPRRREWPLELLWLAPLGLLAAWGVARRRAAAVSAARLGGALGVLACLALATLPIPVVFSTSTAFETQAFAFVYLAGWAFVADETARFAHARRAPRAAIE
jgi:hypothetical protein